MSTLCLDWHHLRNKRNPFSLLFLFCASLSSEEWGEASVHRPTTGARSQETVVFKNSQRTLAHRTRVVVCSCNGGICLCIARTIKRNSHGFSNKDAKNELIQLFTEVYITSWAHLETRLSTSGKSFPPVWLGFYTTKLCLSHMVRRRVVWSVLQEIVMQLVCSCVFLVHQFVWLNRSSQNTSVTVYICTIAFTVNNPASSTCDSCYCWRCES